MKIKISEYNEQNFVNNRQFSETQFSYNYTEMLFIKGFIQSINSNRVHGIAVRIFVYLVQFVLMNYLMFKLVQYNIAFFIITFLSTALSLPSQLIYQFVVSMLRYDVDCNISIDSAIEAVMRVDRVHPL